MTYARIIGVGSALPQQKISNLDLVQKGIPTSHEWIVERTGIVQRHFANANETSATLGLEAAQNALKMAGVLPQNVDLIIVATSTPDMIFPSTACLIQKNLNNTVAAAFDVQAVCCGFIYALSIAEKFIQSGTHQNILVIGAEVFSRILDWEDRATCVLFGDGAGAVLLTADEKTGILSSALHANGDLLPILNVPGQIQNGTITGDPFLRMDGQAVFRFATKAMANVAEEVMQKAKVSIENIQWLIPHQANIRIIEAVGKRLKIPFEKVVVTVAEHGNTSAASVPLALDVAVRDGRIQKGDKLILEAVGGGITWGAVLLEW